MNAFLTHRNLGEKLNRCQAAADVFSVILICCWQPRVQEEAQLKWVLAESSDQRLFSPLPEEWSTCIEVDDSRMLDPISPRSTLLLHLTAWEAVITGA
jgi:hypothetical protein